MWVHIFIDELHSYENIKVNQQKSSGLTYITAISLSLVTSKSAHAFLIFFFNKIYWVYKVAYLVTQYYAHSYYAHDIMHTILCTYIMRTHSQ